MRAYIAQLSILFPLSPLAAVTIKNILVTPEQNNSEPTEQIPPALIRIACEQLSAYFDGRLEKFNLPVAPSRIDPQYRFWTVMADIPYGQAQPCRQLAADIRGITRAFSDAEGKSHTPIILSCHRTMGSGHKLTDLSSGSRQKSEAFLPEA